MMADTYIAVFAAVLGANLLTVCFVWACFHISRREQRQEGVGAYLIGFVMPLLFCLFFTMAATDKVPDWLNYALQ